MMAQRQDPIADEQATLMMDDPLPQRFLTGSDGVGGRIKVRPEDFLVEELPLYPPCGEGPHLFVGVEKTRVAHSELMTWLCRHFGVSRSAIGFAGMKDKQGVTRQTVSIHLPPGGRGREPDHDIGHDRIRLLWAERHRHKIRRGQLAGNRFSIRIRDVDAMQAPRVLRQVRVLEQKGVPCYFGSQRFGYRRNNHRVGLMLLRQQWQGVLDELLGSTGSWYPPYQQERRELYDAGRYAEAASAWSVADRAEIIAVKALAQGKAPRESCLACGTTALSFWMSALQSAVFNRVVDERIDAGTLDGLVEGDLAWRHDSRTVFDVTTEALSEGGLIQPLGDLEISPSGPLWGADMALAAGATAVAEEAALHRTTGLSCSALLQRPRTPGGGRRPLRESLRHAAVDSGVDEHGHYIRVAFDLPRGVYATVVLREITKESE
jgi:tRNA pseudouridine13 synthase